MRIDGTIGAVPLGTVDFVELNLQFGSIFGGCWFC